MPVPVFYGRGGESWEKGWGAGQLCCQGLLQSEERKEKSKQNEI